MRPRVAVVTPRSASGAIGGAERFYAGLRDALGSVGLDTTIVEDTCDESNFESILRSYLRFYDLDLSGFDGVISTKAPTYAVRHPNHVCYLVHTMRVFYDMFDREFPNPSLALHSQRRRVQELDSAALAPSRLKALHAIGEEVAVRLGAYNGLTASVLHPPTSLSGFRRGSFRHVLLPGRLHRWKRVDLAIAAMRHVENDIELVVPGSGEDAERYRAMAAGDPRIRFLGRVSDAALLDLYADSLVVLFLPEREDLGLVTFEAFLSGKPVITCMDSGEPARLVREGVSGFVCSPNPRAIATRIEELASDPARAAAMGAAGDGAIRRITWPTVAATLAGALGLAVAAP
jgi:glycosyltransferase involved in cell wall biosynthesis